MLENSTFESDSLKKGLSRRVTTELNVLSTSFKQLKQAVLQIRVSVRTLGLKKQDAAYDDLVLADTLVS